MPAQQPTLGNNQQCSDSTDQITSQYFLTPQCNKDFLGWFANCRKLAVRSMGSTIPCHTHASIHSSPHSMDPYKVTEPCEYRNGQ